MQFCLAYDQNYTVNWHHDEIAKALEAVERGEITRLIIEMPPRHGKSQLASVYFPAWYLGRNPDKEVITASYSGDLAVKFGAQTRDVISDKQYQAIFSTKLKEDSKAKGEWRTDEGGSYTSVGRGGATTGRGADVFLIDDPFKDRQEAESKVIRDACWDWYTSVVYTRLEKNGAIIIIMTRWHTDDIVGRVLKKAEETGEVWHRVSFPAIAEENEPHRRIGEALWPEKKNVAELEMIKKLDLYDWYALWQQRPIASETQEFKKEWFKYFTDEDIKTKDLNYYVMVDLAISEKESADNTAIVVVAKETDKPDIYVVDVTAGHLDPLQVIEYLFHLKRKYGIRLIRVGIESVAYQKALQYFIEEEQRRRQEYFDIVELKATVGSKEMRIRGLIPMYKAGVIYHRATQTELEEEALTFPKGTRDDRLDGLAYVQQILENTVKTVQYRPKQYIPMTKYGG